MKPVENKLILETEGLTESKHVFKVSQNKRMFEILSSNIYRNKPLAVVREYSCNAYDAHVAAGKKDVPFEVHLPNAFEPYFYIRDFGTGLSPEDVTDLYTTYGRSTKTNENESIGMLGLGSKSAFAYTDQFTVTTYWNGIEYTYSAFLSEEGVPTITLLMSQQTTEENGLKIYVPVKSSDFKSFEDSAIKVFEWFEVKPSILGSSVSMETRTEYLIDTDTYSVFKTGKLSAYEYREIFGFMGGVIIKQGNVVYPVRYADFDKDSLTPEQGEVLQSRYSNLLIKLPIGSVDISASREELNYDKNTQKTIKEVLQKVLDNITNEVQKQVDECKEETDLWLKFHTVSDQLTLAALEKCKFKGVSIKPGDLSSSFPRFYLKDKTNTGLLSDVLTKNDLGLKKLRSFSFDLLCSQETVNGPYLPYTRFDPNWVKNDEVTSFVFIDKSLRHLKETLKGNFSNRVVLYKDYSEKNKKDIIRILTKLGVKKDNIYDASALPVFKKSSIKVQKDLQCTFYLYDEDLLSRYYVPRAKSSSGYGRLPKRCKYYVTIKNTNCYGRNMDTCNCSGESLKALLSLGVLTRQDIVFVKYQDRADLKRCYPHLKDISIVLDTLLESTLKRVKTPLNIYKLGVYRAKDEHRNYISSDTLFDLIGLKPHRFNKELSRLYSGLHCVNKLGDRYYEVRQRYEELIDKKTKELKTSLPIIYEVLYSNLSEQTKKEIISWKKGN